MAGPHAARSERSRWYDGELYAQVMDRLLSGLRDNVAAHLPEGERVLDACCGTGALSRQLARGGRRVVGVDLSPRHIRYARRRADTAGANPARLRFEVGDVARLETPDEGPHDVAVIVLALHEMSRDARAPVVRRLTSVARRTVLVDFVAPMPHNLAGLRNRAAELAAGLQHLTAFRDFQDQGGLPSLVADAGLAIEEDRTINAGTLQVMTVTAA